MPKERTVVDEQTLAEQFAKTGNIMDLCRNETWVRESARIEAECDGRIEAGLSMKAYAEAKYDASLSDVRKAMHRQMRIQSILFSELRLWMEEWEMGSAFEATYTEARQLIRAHLKQPSPELQNWVEAVLTEDDRAEDLAASPIRTQTRAQLSLMMTDQDWATLAQVAAGAAANLASESVLKASKLEPQSTVAA